MTRAMYLALVLAALATGCVEETSPTHLLDTPPVTDHVDVPEELESPERDLRELLVRHGGATRFVLPDTLEALPQDPSNPLTPARVELGGVLFHDPLLADRPRRLAGRHTYACATCHIAERGFQGGVAQSIGEGGLGMMERRRDDAYSDEELDVQSTRTPSVLHVAYHDVLLWSGALGAAGSNLAHRDVWRVTGPGRHNALGWSGPETQALAGLEVHRLTVEQEALRADATYIALFDAAFPELPVEDRITQGNAARAIAAWERSVVATRAPWQRWLRGEHDAMSPRQIEGALLFFGQAGCVECHDGPALASDQFHGLGLADLVGLGTGPPERLGRGGFTLEAEDRHTFKTPQLYNLRGAGPLGHGGSISGVRAMIAYKNNAVAENPWVPEGVLAPTFVALGLTDDEIDALTAFVEEALFDPDLIRHVPSALPSGACFPANDPISRVELGCEAR